jgi:Holliday junction DNA helicase RuvA
MIAAVRGTLEALDINAVVVAVGGVSIRVLVPTSTVAELGVVGSSVHLHTSLVVREDAITLYGFVSEGALRIFEKLLEVSGVGPRHALGLLSTMSPEGLALAITSEDTVALSRAPGIGKRTAARVVLELKEKLGREWAVSLTSGGIQNDVVAALVALGYSPTEAGQAQAGISTETASLEEQVRRALQRLGGR